jgi:tetratricopeptide (TPR) repeat protein
LGSEFGSEALLWAKLPSMLRRTYKEFSMPIVTTLLLQASDIRDSAHWYWRLQDANGAFLADHTVALDSADWRYEALLDLYGYLKRYAAPDKRREEETRLLNELGAWIGEQVLGPIAPALVKQAPVTVRVQIPNDSPAAAGLCYLPLELAHAGGKPLAVQDVSLVFEVGKPAPVKLQPVGERLRVLAVFSLPTGENSLNLRQERYRLKKLIRQLTAARGWAVDLRVVQYGVTRDALRDMLEEGEGWDVLHFSGHGLAAKVVLEKLDGRPDVVTSEELVKLLRLGRGRLKWVTLSACLSAAATAAETLRWLGLEPTRRFGESAADETTATVEPLPALAQTLVENLNCAVLAMRYPVGDAFAIELGERLYRSVLEKGQPLSRALQLVLPGILETADGSPLAVATPALFGAAAADLTFRVPKQARKSFETAPTGLAGFPPEPALFVGRVGVLAQASQALAPESGVAGVLFYGMAGAGKTYCALELTYHYEGLQRFQGYVWYQAPELGKDISPLLDFTRAMERQLPGFAMVEVVDEASKLDAFLPRLTEQLEQESILLVLDNLESLLRPEGQWRDERWGKLVTALLNHRGFSRVILTSRIRPLITGIPSDTLLELPIHALSLDETVLLARQSDYLGRLLRGDGVTDGQQRDHQRQVVLEALRLVQGHPKLLDLADKQAVDLATLEQHLARAGQAWTTGWSQLDAFFQQGESALADTDFLRVLADWTDIVAATLPVAAQDLFHFLCGLEENDRQTAIVEANWADLWRRLERVGDPPALAVPLAALTAAGLVAANPLATTDPTALVQIYRLHPAVAEAGQRRAGQAFQTAVDTELAAFWRARFDSASKQEMQGAGGLLVHAGRAAALYLLRQRRWEEAAGLLDRVLVRDATPATLAAVLPWLEHIEAATAGTELGVSVAGLLARALRQAGRWGEAEGRLRALLDSAVRQQAFRLASGIAGDLIILLRDTSRFHEALVLAEQKQDYTRRASLGPVTQLSDEAQRLQLLVQLGQYEEVLAAVKRLWPTLQTLPEIGDQAETVDPWNIRETILATGRSAALNLKRWELALALNTEVLRSAIARRAPALEQAGTRFNDYGPLLRLRRYPEARAVLEYCRAIYIDENAVPRLGNVFSALAYLETTLNHLDQAIALERTALRYKYLTGNPEDCAISHFNLAIYLLRDSSSPPKVALAHRLAAALIRFQTASGMFASRLHVLAKHLASFPANPPLPADFAALCVIVDQVEGVHFRNLFERLPQNEAVTGDEALQKVLELAKSTGQH